MKYTAGNRLEAGMLEGTVAKSESEKMVTDLARVLRQIKTEPSRITLRNLLEDLKHLAHDGMQLMEHGGRWSEYHEAYVGEKS